MGRGGVIRGGLQWLGRCKSDLHIPGRALYGLSDGVCSGFICKSLFPYVPIRCCSALCTPRPQFHSLFIGEISADIDVAVL